MSDESIPHLLDAAARQWTNAPAISGHTTTSYRALYTRVHALAHALAEAGAQPGEIVATALPRDARHVAVLYAILSAGCVVCPLDPKLPETALQNRLQRVGAAHLVTPNGIEPGPGHARAEEPGVLVFTSGSSAEPKAAFLTVGNLAAAARASNSNIPVRPGDAWLLSLPLHHVSGLGVLFRCLTGGGAVEVPAPETPLLEALDHAEVTHVSLVAAQLRRLLDTESGVQALAPLKTILLGGGPIPAALVRRASSHGLNIHTSYGLTELGSQATTTRPGEPLDGLFSSGHALEPNTVAVADDGEILVRGERLFRGYWENGTLTPPDLWKGWFSTRDLGRFDDAGRMVIVGRKDNMFVCGGENIQPEEIEAHLLEIDNVTEVLVVATADDALGNVPVAYVRMTDDAPPDEAHLSASLEKVLPRFKIPKRFLSWPSALDADGAIKTARARLSREG